MSGCGYAIYSNRDQVKRNHFWAGVGGGGQDKSGFRQVEWEAANEAAVSSRNNGLDLAGTRDGQKYLSITATEIGVESTM